jgi:predicted Zn-dependent peptidase
MGCLQNWYQFGIDKDAEYEAALNSLTPADVQAAVQEVLSQGNVINIASFPAK